VNNHSPVVIDELMQININDRKNLFAIQEEFNNLFPYLKIEFFSKITTAAGNSPGKFEINRTVGQSRTIQSNAEIEITPSMTVHDLEMLFRENYGIRIQVLRKSGKAWLETTVTDGWTLQEQNKQGEALSKTPV
jgi:hypothetical protein